MTDCQHTKEQLVDTAVKHLKKKIPGSEIVKQFIQQGFCERLAQVAVQDAIDRSRKTGNKLVCIGFVLMILLTGHVVYQYVQQSSNRTVNVTALLIELGIDLVLCLCLMISGMIVKDSAKM